MMARTTSVVLRGEEISITIDRDSGYEWDTGAHDIEWHFTDLSAEEHEALQLTQEEEDAIYVHLAGLDSWCDDEY